MLKRKKHHKDLEKATNRIYRVTALLGFIALAFLFIGITGASSGDLYALILVFIGIVFAVLAYFSLKKPFVPVLIGSIIYGIFYVIALLGQFWPTLIIAAFVLGIIAAKKN
jgi:hypothetical protein